MDCKNLNHPFQNDPGISQRQRIMDDLLSGQATIDGRTLADLLDYFVQLSRHVNYYDAERSISDWQPFFQKSIPFSVAAISRHDADAIREKIDFYGRLFEKHPSGPGLQLLTHYIFYNVIDRINAWHLQVLGSALPVEFALESLIVDKLRNPIAKFIQHTNAAVKWYCIKSIDWQRLYDNEVWALDITDLYSIDESFRNKAHNKREMAIILRDAIIGLVPVFQEVTRTVADAAVMSMEQSLLPLKEELQEKHPPHLSILFAFLKLFQHLQGDLNQYTRKHLDFFYKRVLQLHSREAVPDSAHIVFELQNQLNSYLLPKGLQVKDGKDSNKAEVLFALDNEIVVNKTQVAEKRTLFLNNQTVYDTTYLEGVYMAPDAGKADGLEKDFKDHGSGSFSTMGARDSKYMDPEHQFIKPYPNARLGFVLASPVLLLNEGQRTITIHLACELHPDICKDMKVPAGASSSCCDDGEAGTSTNDDLFIQYRSFAPSTGFYAEVGALLNRKYYYISQDLIGLARKKGIGAILIGKLTAFLTEKKEVCYCETDIIKFDAIVPATGTAGDPGFEDVFSQDERTLLSEFFKPRGVINTLYSGAKEWLSPATQNAITLTPPALPGSRKFMLTIRSVFEPDKPAITFYDKEKLKEDLNVDWPVVKIELDDKIKIWQEIVPQSSACCLERELGKDGLHVSPYHFFRNVVLIDKIGNNPAQKDDETGISVSVCELRNFIVQNDESVQDVSSPVYPFGTRPAIADFDIVNPATPPLANPNLIGPNFYIGSNEVFCKRWGAVRININWKDKPSDFREHYKAYVVEDVATQTFGLDEDEFKIRLSVLQDRNWSEEAADRKLFDTRPPAALPNILPSGSPLCEYGDKYEQSIVLDAADFPASGFCIEATGNTPLDVNSDNGFIKLNLRNQDFLHKDYAFVLARQMMALGRFPDAGLEGAVYVGSGNTVIVFKDIGALIVDISQDITTAAAKAGLTKTQADNILTQLGIVTDPGSPGGVSITPTELLNLLSTPINNTVINADDTKTLIDSIIAKINTLQLLLSIFKPNGELIDDLSVPIPNEPWTPIIRNLSIDYTASASISDIDLIHLYPYHGTFKHEEISLRPTLLPVFCDEGTLFLGLQHLVPGSNVNILFQLAEATADSESERSDQYWFYLDNNQWKMLRQGFEVLEDETNGLTTSGIIKFALPANMTDENTILPKGLHWIKAVAPSNSRSVSETSGIHTQAIHVTFTNEDKNDKLRLANGLPAGSIAKLKVADASVKKVSQPYESRGGRMPEAEGHFYVRVSELLRHKGRAIQKFDYERLILEGFPMFFKAKCINHSFALNANRYANDFPVAPGYVMIAVIPDLNQLKGVESYEPRVPVSLLEQAREYLSHRTSPFVRLRLMNPRYEKVHICMEVKFHIGRDENFYKEKLKQDTREFLAPWAVGQYDKLAFGQCLYRSDLVRFMETRDYLDYIIDLRMNHEDDAGPPSARAAVYPITPRSILIAGDIDVCVRPQDCSRWGQCYDNDQQEKDCCDHEKILLADYCNDKRQV